MRRATLCNAPRDGHCSLAVTAPMYENPLLQSERLFYRDRLRNARYAALADAESFGDICFAIEALGMRLRGREGTMRKYYPKLENLAACTPTHEALAEPFPGSFTRFEALYSTVHKARNDAMHSGSYARHATAAAIELCICLEEAVMSGLAASTKVADYMVKTPMCVEPWQPIAHARQVMLMHSFSFLPVYLGGWKLLSEYSVAQFLHSQSNRYEALALNLEDAVRKGLSLKKAKILRPNAEVSSVFAGKPGSSPTLWLVVERNRTKSLAGVLSPFELM